MRGFAYEITQSLNLPGSGKNNYQEFADLWKKKTEIDH